MREKIFSGLLLGIIFWFGLGLVIASIFQRSDAGYFSSIESVKSALGNSLPLSLFLYIAILFLGALIEITSNKFIGRLVKFVIKSVLLGWALSSFVYLSSDYLPSGFSLSVRGYLEKIYPIDIVIGIVVMGSILLTISRKTIGKEQRNKELQKIKIGPFSLDEYGVFFGILSFLLLHFIDSIGFLTFMTFFCVGLTILFMLELRTNNLRKHKQKECSENEAAPHKT